MKIMNIVGARPQFIKLAPFCAELARHHTVENVIVNTGQHYDYALSKVFFDELNIPTPHYNLGVRSGSHLFQMGHIILQMDAILDTEKPDIVVVYGDTNTTAAAAIAAAKNGFPLAHIEAGLREHDKSIPEEINKLLTDAVADLLFAPTQTGVNNLVQLGRTKDVYLVGDIGIDLLVAHQEKIAEQVSGIMTKYGIEPQTYVLMTCHRAANTDHPANLRQILEAMSAITDKVIFPVHPRTMNAIKRYGFDTLITGKNIIVVPPIGFWETQALIQQAKFCLTDSGGIIKESYFHRVPAIIIDKQTEWIETVEEGWNQVVGPWAKDIAAAIERVNIKPAFHSSCLGNGTASRQIYLHIKQYLHAKQ